MDLKICSFNCCSLSKNIDVVRDLAGQNYELLFLQETFLTDNRLGDLAFIDENYEAVGSGSVYSERAIESNAGRSEGGMACLWKRDTQFKINKVIIEKNFIVVSLEYNSLIILVVNVYIRSDIWETHTLHDYLESLSQLGDIVTEMKYDSIYFVGDFNADPFSGRSWNNLKTFMYSNHLKCIDVDMLDEETFTFISYGNAYTKWLDHVVGRDSNCIRVNDVSVLYDKIGSDHLPLIVHIIIESTESFSSVSHNRKNDRAVVINWERLTAEDIDMIENEVIRSLYPYSNSDAFLCTKLGCRDINHCKQLKDFYCDLSKSVMNGASYFVKEVKKKNKFKVIPGWNRKVKQLHANARNIYLTWINKGRNKVCIEFELMKETRRLFKAALNDCKINEIREISLSIQEKFANKDMTSFWKEVQKRNNKVKHSEIIDGKSNNSEIVDIFNNKFLKTEEMIDNDQPERDLLHSLRENWHTSDKFHLKISSVTLKELISRLSVGEGHDGLHALFLRKVSDRLLSILSSFMTACYSHCCTPVEVLHGDINPTLKDPKGNVTESSNYRPVMQSSCLLKLFEMHILDVLNEKLFFNCRQFGFKKETSTTDACFILKETVNKYTYKGGKVHGLFIDLSKAFDTVDHFQLGQMLLQRNVPPDIALFLIHYLRNQRARIVWNGLTGEYRNIEKGVRQGGILSPLLFKLYIDDVLQEIAQTNIGCRLGILRINILAYADDLVLLAATLCQLNQLYKILENKFKQLKLNINKDKSKCMIFRKTRESELQNKILICDREFEVVTSYKYLGHILQSNLMDTLDMEFRLNSFFAKFNWLFRNFKNISSETLLYLFNAFCTPDYGLSLWNNGQACRKQIFKSFEVAYSNALKKIHQVPISTSSHQVANKCNTFLFNHHVAYVQARFFKRAFKSSNVILRLSSVFLREGYLYQSLYESFSRVYHVHFLSNELYILKSRIFWVQRHEPTTGRPLEPS